MAARANSLRAFIDNWQTQPPCNPPPMLVFDVATAVGPWLLRAIARIAAVALGLAYFARERLPLPARRLVESALAVPLALAIVHLWLAVAASAAIVAAAWHEHRRGDTA